MNLRRHYPILLACFLVLAFFLLVLGGQRVIAYTTSSQEAGIQAAEGVDHSAEVDLFDDSQVHSLQILISEADYERMISTYQNTGEKDYFQADVILDGVRINDVGLRLKGNASLMSALGGTGSMGAGMDRGAGMQLPEGFEPPDLPEGSEPASLGAPFAPASPPAGFDPANPLQAGQGLIGQPPGGMAPGGVFGTTAAQGGTLKIPLLIKFDEFVSGQTYQGHTKLALRTYGISYDEAMLAEPITNFAFELLDLPAAQVAFTGLRINDQDETLYVLSEVIDDPAYLKAHFADPGGVLFKAEVGSSLTYVGDDPSAYAASFSQETRQNDADAAALIDFARFLTQSDDATFARELPEHLDTGSFATYLAITNLLVNNDSIAGMNNNYYLYFDESAGRFSLLYWDGNESLGGLAMGGSTNADLYFENISGMRMPGGSQNILLERFLAAPAFRALYEQKLVLVYQAAFSSGALEAKVGQLAAVVQAANETRQLVDRDAYDQAVEATLAFLAGRREYLETTDLLGTTAR